MTSPDVAAIIEASPASPPAVRDVIVRLRRRRGTKMDDAWRLRLRNLVKYRKTEGCVDVDSRVDEGER